MNQDLLYIAFIIASCVSGCYTIYLILKFRVGEAMNREHTREHMIFQLLVNTHFTEEQLNTMSDKQIRLYYDYFVERVEPDARRNI